MSNSSSSSSSTGAANVTVYAGCSTDDVSVVGFTIAYHAQQIALIALPCVTLFILLFSFFPVVCVKKEKTSRLTLFTAALVAALLQFALNGEYVIFGRVYDEAVIYSLFAVMTDALYLTLALVINSKREQANEAATHAETAGCATETRRRVLAVTNILNLIFLTASMILGAIYIFQKAEHHFYVLYATLVALLGIILTLVVMVVLLGSLTIKRCLCECRKPANCTLLMVIILTAATIGGIVIVILLMHDDIGCSYSFNDDCYQLRFMAAHEQPCTSKRVYLSLLYSAAQIASLVFWSATASVRK